ncbi:MAG TPA: fused MFS/spermidine synthase [Rhizomicrobium sp.]
MIPIEDIETEYGTIHIAKVRATGALIYDVGGRRQAAADGNGTSLAYYIHAILGLLIQAKARDILMIGGAGCTLGTMLARAQRRATIVDVNPASFAVARQHFSLPEAVICHVADGEAFLRDEAATYDAVVLDAFHGDDIPAHLLSPQFFGLARERLMPGGALFANILVRHDFDDSADRAAKSMKSAWPDVRVLDTVGLCDRNAIVMAGGVSHLRPPEMLLRPQMNARAIDSELRALRFRAWKASRWDF